MFMPQQRTKLMDRFYKELERVFDKFPKYHMKILLGDFNARVGREDIFKPTIGNESLHEITSDNGGRPRRKWVDNIEMDLREIGWHKMLGSS
jgi:exonuclease III